MAAPAKKNSYLAIWISVAVVAALVLVGALVVWMNNTAAAPGAAPEGPGIDSSTGAIAVGSGPDEVDVWFDFYCPHCQDFEDVYGPTLDELVTSGDITLNLHPVALSGLNAASGTDFSERSASALYCVATQDTDAAFAFTQTLLTADVTGAGWTDDELIALAADSGVTGIDECITQRTYVYFVDAQTREIPASPQGGQGTPTLVINGEYISLTGDVNADIVNRLS